MSSEIGTPNCDDDSINVYSLSADEVHERVEYDQVRAVVDFWFRVSTNRSKKTIHMPAPSADRTGDDVRCNTWTKKGYDDKDVGIFPDVFLEDSLCPNCLRDAIRGGDVDLLPAPVASENRDAVDGDDGDDSEVVDR